MVESPIIKQSVENFLLSERIRVHYIVIWLNILAMTAFVTYSCSCHTASMSQKYTRTRFSTFLKLKMFVSVLNQASSHEMLTGKVTSKQIWSKFNKDARKVLG